MAITIFDLPIEVRELIYLECDLHLRTNRPPPTVTTLSHYINGYKSLPPACVTKYPLLPLLAVNKQMRAEVLGLFSFLAHKGQINFDMSILVKGDEFRPSWTTMTLGMPPASTVNNLTLWVVAREDYRDPNFGPTLSERPVEMITGLARFIVLFLHYGPSFLDAPPEYHMCFMDPFRYLNSSYSDTRRSYSTKGYHRLENLLVRVQADGDFSPDARTRIFREFIWHMRMVAKLDPVIELVERIRLEVGYVDSDQPIRAVGEWEPTDCIWNDDGHARSDWTAASNWKWLSGDEDLIN